MNSTTVLPGKKTEMENNKDVVVTGVSARIGWGTTKVLVSKGFRVFGSVRKQADTDRLQSEFGNGFVPLMMDIMDADALLYVMAGTRQPDPIVIDGLRDRAMDTVFKPIAQEGLDHLA